MKKIFALAFAWVAFSGITAAHSAMMEVTWTGIIGIMRLEPEFRFGLNVGDEISISAIYDDSGTEMHIFSDADGSIVDTFNTSTNPDALYMSDATISFSSNMQEYIDNSFGVTDENWSWVVESRSTGLFSTHMQSHLVSINLRSVEPGIGQTGTDSVPVWTGLADGKDNPIYFSSLIYSINPHIPPSPPTGTIPEPTTMLLFGTGIAGLAAVGRKRK